MGSAYKRIPTFLANLPLRLLPLTAKQQAAYDKTGFVTDLAFKTTPKAGKIEIKQFLERVYGLDVASVRTANFQGSKHRGKTGHYYRRADWKKAHVTLRPPASTT